MNIGIYFNPEETKWIKEQPEGTVRGLVQDAMGVVFNRGVAPKNPNACRECGQIKASGRCINNKCEMKGRLQ